MLKRILLAFGLYVALQSTASSAAFDFKPPVRMEFAGTTWAVAVGDVNADGRDDMATIVGSGLEVFLQDADGALSIRISLGSPPLDYLTVTLGDVDGDGGNEVLVGHDSGLMVYKWDGSGLAGENQPSQYPCWYMATADLDLDGVTDVFCHGRYGDATLYYSGPGYGFGSPVYMLTAIHANSLCCTTFDFELADVTGDGTPDLIAAGSTSNSFLVYPHDGTRGFLPAVAYPYPYEDNIWSRTIEVADLDDDGVDEIVAANSCGMPCSSILLYKRGANGYFYLSREMPTYESPSVILARDIDKDGRHDLIVGHGGWFTVGLYMGRAGGLSTSEWRFDVQTQGGSDRYALGDLNGDGLVDLAIANSLGVSVLHGARRTSNDFNGDRVSDLLWRHSLGSNAIWLSTDKTTPLAIDPIDPDWSVQAVGDFDGDGFAETFWRNRATGANEVWMPLYGYRTPVTGVTSRAWQVVGAGDFDGDNEADLLWRNSNTGANILWKSADPARRQNLVTVTDLRWQVVGTGDFDGDGRSDIVWRHSTLGRNVIWRSGNRSNPQAMTGVTNLAWKVAGVGDFNGDGKDDVVWRNTKTGANTIWLSAKGSTQQSVRGVTNLAWTIAAVGDYNGDARADLMWRNTATGANVAWRSANAKQQQAVTSVANLRWGIVP
jgi:hypothetical protein